MRHQVKIKDLHTWTTKKAAFDMIAEKGLAYSPELIAVFSNGKLKDVHPNYSPF